MEPQGSSRHNVESCQPHEDEGADQSEEYYTGDEDASLDGELPPRNSREFEWSGDPSFADLPEEILYIIFAWLHPDDLVRCGQVCRKWRHLSLYPHFWTRIFSSRSRYGHQLKLLNLRSDQVGESQDLRLWSCPRDVYLAVRRHGERDVQSVSASLSNYVTYSWRSWLGFYPPKFMVIGSAASNVVTGGDYEITRLSDMRFPGVFSGSLPGVNSVTLKTPTDPGGRQTFLKWRLELVMVKSYAMESHQKNVRAQERLNESVLLQKPPATTSSPITNDTSRRTQSNASTRSLEPPQVDWSQTQTVPVVQQISSHFVGFIYIINGEKANMDDLYLLSCEFRAFLRNFQSRPEVPVLVILAWRKVPSKLTLYQVVQTFHLPGLRHPWAVYDWDVKKRQGFMEGLTWLAMRVMS